MTKTMIAALLSAVLFVFLSGCETKKQPPATGQPPASGAAGEVEQPASEDPNAADPKPEKPKSEHPEHPE